MDWDNIPRRITVTSFYMDETEIANLNYREYLYWTAEYMAVIILKYIIKRFLTL